MALTDFGTWIAQVVNDLGPQAEEYFSRLRRAEIGIHHHIAGAYLFRYAQESSWREDTLRLEWRSGDPRSGAGDEARQERGLYRLLAETCERLSLKPAIHLSFISLMTASRPPVSGHLHLNYREQDVVIGVRDINATSDGGPLRVAHKPIDKAQNNQDGC